MSKPRYIAHTGGKQPVAGHVSVELVITHWGVCGPVKAGQMDWRKSRHGASGQIIAYRVIDN